MRISRCWIHESGFEMVVRSFEFFCGSGLGFRLTALPGSCILDLFFPQPEMLVCWFIEA